VLEIAGGILIGPSVLGWVHVDLPVQILALLRRSQPAQGPAVTPPVPEPNLT
jgi:hypothetical protein